MSGPQAGEPARDPGAQPERTRLAWRRTTLTFAVSVGLVVRGALYDASPASAVAVALALLSWLGFLAVAHRRITSLAAARPRRSGGRHLQAAALCTVAMAVGGVLLLW